MRNAMLSTLALGAAILIGLAETSPGFAKAHDNGVSNVNNEGTSAASSPLASGFK